MASLAINVNKFMERMSSDKFERKNENSSSILTEETMDLDSTGNLESHRSISKGKYLEIRENMHMIPLT